MARKKRAPKGPSNAYLMSFGDTMTTLLAFFIVLNSLAEDQTGANLYQGTGSFVRAMNSLGLTGHITGERGQRVAQMSHTHPDYIVPPDEPAPHEQESLGPDEESNNIRVIDRETEDFQRFINEVQRVAGVESLPNTRAEAVFDFFSPLARNSPRLSADYHKSLSDVLPLLYRTGYEIEVIVWATSPSPSARERATLQAAEVGEELASLARLQGQQRLRLSSSGRPWIDPHAKRPVLSIRVRRTAPERRLRNALSCVTNLAGPCML